MKVEIEIEEVPKTSMYMWEEGFTLKEGKKEVLVFGTTVPGGLPYIFVHDGPNEGKRFYIKTEEMKRVCIEILKGKIK